MNLQRAGYRMTQHVVNAVSAQPTLYYGLRKLTGTMDDLCIRRDTELVIEGYPRSANSTTVHEFLARQIKTVRIAQALPQHLGKG